MTDVSCAIIIKDGKVLVAQRSPNGKLPLKWEFPGGKVEKNETIAQSLEREIREELNIEILVGRALAPVEHHYPNLSIRLYPFLCKYISGELILNEHNSIRWTEKKDLLNFDWAEADVPVVKEFLKLWTGHITVEKEIEITESNGK